ncbi:hypothetical protein CC86DRAFT_27963 [Ophiobolus disseminans]|uniref:Uncharacterized protein n=1 Tax=Ophiobolus disseminans TaxID=1469910 RepID=A0A6A7A191_9PLEO|nr:hypothetical protein CC86DRAFT_27963 [Ophiobolus disseminans]
MPISVTFVLGKKENYFFNTPTHWAWHNLPPDIEALFTKSPNIKDVIELALGSNGTYFISYRDHDGQVLCKHYNLPNALTSWLYCSHPSVVRDLVTLSVTLGPYDSYYAWDKSSASWSNLPPKLEKSILNRLEHQDAWKTTWKANGAEAPSFVSLGADEAYWMRTVSGGGCWDLKCSAPPSNPGATDGMAGLRGMNKFLEDSSDFNGVAGLHLFPSHPDAYILITMAGKAFSNLPEFTWVDYNKLSPALPSFAQGLLPIPPMPKHRQQAPPAVQPQPGISPQPTAQPQVQYQQPIQSPQPQQHHNCCPPTAPGAPHNCCVQQPVQPVQPRPFGLPVAVPYYAQPVMQQFHYGAAPLNGQQGGYPNGGYGAGPVYR